MLKQWFAAAAVGAMLAGAPAFAQSTAAPPKPTDFLTQEKPDQWRASKLAGVAIYGDNDQKVGSITDILVGHDGKAQYIVIGVGGFLGIGKKDVAVPFESVTFSEQPVRRTTAQATPPAVTPAPGPMAPAAPDAMTPGGTGPATTATITPRAAYPDHGTIAMTKDQLKAAPDFKFVR
jgi:sporulation protein YlmC with PRC-barrel domain